MLTRRQKERLSKLCKEVDAEKSPLPLKKKKIIGRESRRVSCPICLEPMDSAYVLHIGSKFLGWFCLNECRAGSEYEC